MSTRSAPLLLSPVGSAVLAGRRRRGLAGLARAIERAPDLDPLLAQMRVRQQEREGLLAAIASPSTTSSNRRKTSQA